MLKLSQKYYKWGSCSIVAILIMLWNFSTNDVGDTKWHLFYHLPNASCTFGLPGYFFLVKLVLFAAETIYTWRKRKLLIQWNCAKEIYIHCLPCFEGLRREAIKGLSINDVTRFWNVFDPISFHGLIAMLFRTKNPYPLHLVLRRRLWTTPKLDLFYLDPVFLY